MTESLKAIDWIGSAKRDLKAMPEEAQDLFGYALYRAQQGSAHRKAKVLKGFGAADVLEVVMRDKDSTYRAVYTVRIAETVYVLHCFQKKSKKGIATPRADMDVIRRRLKIAEARAKEGKNERDQRSVP